MLTAFKLLTCVVLCFIPALIGGLVGFPAEWYQKLAKPTWTPPSSWFAPVWTFLYISMGVSIFLIVSKGIDSPGVRLAVGVFCVQLLLNACWVPIGFGRQSLVGALLMSVALWLAVAATIACFWSVRDWAAVILIPYFLWITLATALSAALWRMNPG